MPDRARDDHGTPVRRRCGISRAVLLFAAILLVAPSPPLTAQPLTERTPNLAGPWVSTPWHLDFQFAHRFQTSGDHDITDLFGDAKVVNYPTFDLSLGLPASVMTGVRYSSNSLVADGQPNEWQPYLKWAPVRPSGAGVSFSLLGAWNSANTSLDGELAGRADIGPLFLSGALRGFTDLYGELADEGSDGAFALAGGLGLRLNRYVTLAGDVADIVSGGERMGERPTPGWSAGLHLGIPFTPHTFSIMLTNVTSGTLQGSSGVPADFPNHVYWGFEFTVPFSGFARWGRILDPDDDSTEGRAALASGEAVVEIEISQMSFRSPRLEVPVGTTVRWVNRDPVGHTTTSDDGVWASSLIGPGETYEHTFTESGEFSYHCVPHPFMTASVVVTRG